MSRAPACYFAAHDRIPNRILILMEDMAPLRAADQARPPTLGRLQLHVPRRGRIVSGRRSGSRRRRPRQRSARSASCTPSTGAVRRRKRHTSRRSVKPPLADALCMSRFDCDKWHKSDCQLERTVAQVNFSDCQLDLCDRCSHRRRCVSDDMKHLDLEGFLAPAMEKAIPLTKKVRPSF